MCTMLSEESDPVKRLREKLHVVNGRILVRYGN